MVEPCSAIQYAVGTHTINTKCGEKQNKKQLHMKTKEQSSDSEGSFRFICTRIELEMKIKNMETCQIVCELKSR